MLKRHRGHKITQAKTCHCTAKTGLTPAIAVARNAVGMANPRQLIPERDGSLWS